MPTFHDKAPVNEWGTSTRPNSDELGESLIRLVLLCIPIVGWLLLWMIESGKPKGYDNKGDRIF